MIIIIITIISGKNLPKAVHAYLGGGTVDPQGT